MKNGDIVVVINEDKLIKAHSDLGTIVNNNRFLPMDYGRYFVDDLPEVTEEDIRPAEKCEKIEYIKDGFCWGPILDVICIDNTDKTKGDVHYQIVQYVDKGDDILYHVYLNYKDTNTSYLSFDSALVGAIASNHGDERAAFYADKVLGIDEDE